MGKIKNRDVEILNQNISWLRGITSSPNVTQASIAEHLGVTPATVSRWVKFGKISAEHIVLICQHTNSRPPEWLRSDPPLGVQEAPSVYETLNPQLQNIYALAHSGALTASDLALIEQVASRLAGKNQQIEILQSPQSQPPKDKKNEAASAMASETQLDKPIDL